MKLLLLPELKLLLPPELHPDMVSPKKCPTDSRSVWLTICYGLLNPVATASAGAADARADMEISPEPPGPAKVLKLRMGLLGASCRALVSPAGFPEVTADAIRCAAIAEKPAPDPLIMVMIHVPERLTDGLLLVTTLP